MCLCNGRLAAKWLYRCQTDAASQTKKNANFAIVCAQFWDRQVVPKLGPRVFKNIEKEDNVNKAKNDRKTEMKKT